MRPYPGAQFLQNIHTGRLGWQGTGHLIFLNIFLVIFFDWLYYSIAWRITTSKEVALLAVNRKGGVDQIE